MIARRQRVDDRRFPGAGARRGKDDHRAGGLEDLLAAVEHRPGERGELRAAVVDDWHVHGAKHAIWHRARTGNLQKMSSLMLGHGYLVRCGQPHIALNYSSYNQQIVCIFASTACPSKAYVGSPEIPFAAPFRARSASRERRG